MEENQKPVERPAETVAATTPKGQQQLPNATAVLVLGIISIATCFCYGIIGIATSIIALVLSGKARKLYNENSSLYTESSFNNMKAGRVCAIIGLALSALYLIVIIIYFALIGAAVFSYGTLFNELSNM